MSCTDCREPIPTCKECGCEKPKPCGCAERVLSIEVDPTNPTTLLFNLDGHTVRYDFSSLVKFAETKTTLNADTVGRALRYNSESGTDTITSKELGSIMHLSDIGDVDADTISEGSFLIYQKDDNCAEGCEGINNRWIAWNEDNYRATSLQTAMGFNEDSKPRSLAPPAHTNQYYQLGWNGSSKLSYSQPIKVSSTSNTVAVRMDKTSKQLVYVEE